MKKHDISYHNDNCISKRPHHHYPEKEGNHLPYSKDVLTIEECNDLLRLLTLHIKGQRSLSPKLFQLAKIALNNLGILLRQKEFLIWLKKRKDPSWSITYLIYNYGQLVKANLNPPTLTVGNVQYLLNLLSH